LGKKQREKKGTSFQPGGEEYGLGRMTKAKQPNKGIKKKKKGSKGLRATRARKNVQTPWSPYEKKKGETAIIDETAINLVNLWITPITANKGQKSNLNPLKKREKGRAKQKGGEEPPNF